MTPKTCLEFADIPDTVNGDWHGVGQLPGVDCTGHEGAGRVAAIGPGVKEFKVGDLVGITPVFKTCNEQLGQTPCELCQRGHETICHNKQ